MNAFGAIGYGFAFLSYLLLTLLLITNWRSRRPGVQLIAASAMTSAWALVLLLQHALGSIPVLLIYVIEVLRDAAWVGALIAIAGPAAPRLLVILARASCAALILLAVVAPALEWSAIAYLSPTVLLTRAGLALAVLNLVLLEQIVRNASESARLPVRYFAIGVGALFAYDLFLYSQAELLRGVSVIAWNTRGLLNAAAVPFIAWALRRNPDWSLDIFLSRQAVFYTTTFLIVGAYLVVMALGGFYVRQRGGEWGGVGQIVFFAGAGLALAVLLSSTALRRYARVFISKHFYRNKYDYRIEWLRFIRTLSSTAEDDVRRIGLRAIAQIFSSPGGLLYLYDEVAGQFIPAAAWAVQFEAIEGLSAVRADDDLPRFLARTQWIVDLREYARTPDMYGNLRLPAWLERNPGLRIVSPLLQMDRLVGFIVLYDPPPPFELTYEDRDLLKMVGRHVATHIAQHDADRKLAEGRQFEAYNRLTSFMMHDLKNSVAQLQLIVANADRHRHNPEFIDDAISTIANAVERMTRLIAQLRGTPTADRSSAIGLVDTVQAAIRRCADRRPTPGLQINAHPQVQADPDRFATIIEHVLRNAQDASGEGGSILVHIAGTEDRAEVSIVDDGVGMTTEFLRERLFRPFDSTKGAKGMGIGAYQVREYVRLIGGNVEVQSKPGQGTRFTISLPRVDRADARSVNVGMSEHIPTHAGEAQFR